MWALFVTNANINLSNAYSLTARNNANTTYIPLIQRNTSDKVSIDADGYGTVMGGSVSMWALTAASGTFNAAAPYIQFTGTTGATKTGVIFQNLDTLLVGANGVANYISVNLSNGSTAIQSAVASSSTSTGALIVTGGLGVGGATYMGALTATSSVVSGVHIVPSGSTDGGGGFLTFVGSAGSPNSGKLIIGDGSGWDFRLASRAGGTTTDRLKFYDGGGADFLGGSVSMGALTAGGATFTSGGGFLVNTIGANVQGAMYSTAAHGMAFRGKSGSTTDLAFFNPGDTVVLLSWNAGSTAASFASSVSMGALTASTGNFTGSNPTVSLTGGIPAVLFQSTQAGTQAWKWAGCYNDMSSISLIDVTNGNAQRIYIDNSGNMGIGTVAPAGYRLNVNGSVYMGALTATSGTFSSSVSMGALTATGATLSNSANVETSLTLNPYSGALGTTNRWVIAGGNSGSNYAFQIREGATPYLTINNSAGGGGGNVGIGTTGPDAKLHLYGVDDSTAGGIHLQESSGGYSSYIYNSGSRQNFYAAQFRWSSAGGTRMTLDSSGNVGIGNTAPGYKLDVTGTINSGTGTVSFSASGTPTLNSSQRYLYRSNNAVMWQYSDTQSAELLHSGNIGTNAATLQAAVASATAPLVGTIAQRTAFTPAVGTTPYWYATDETASDGKLGTLRQWTGSAWGAEATPQTVVGRVVAGVISAGAVGAQALAADVALIGQTIRNTGFSAGTSTTPPSGFKFTGTAFTTTYMDGTTASAYGEIGDNFNIGGYKAAIIANRVKGNTYTQTGAGSVDVFIPDGITLITVSIQAAGGNGAASYGHGGNAGQYQKNQIVVKPHNTYRLTIGAVGSDSTFAWLSFDGTSGFTTDSGTKMTCTCGANGSASTGTGGAGGGILYAYPGPESGWNIAGGGGGDGAPANFGASAGAGGNVTGLFNGGAGGATTATKAGRGCGGASALAAVGVGGMNPLAGQAGSIGSGGGGGATGGAVGARYGYARW